MLALVGGFALFAPNELLAMLGAPLVSSLTAVVQLLGTLYLSFAYTNWTAKDSNIGGIYARPTSLGNFAHFTVGTIVIAKSLMSNGANLPLTIAVIVYAVFAAIFGWLAFVYGGTASKKAARE